MPQRFSPELLKRRRIAAHADRVPTAFAIERSVETLSAYERGTQAPPISVLERLAELYRCRVEDLFLELDEPAANIAEEVDHAAAG